MAQHALEPLALIRALTDGVGLALLGVHVAVRPRDVEVTADEERQPGRRLGRVAGQGIEESELGLVVLPPVGHVHGRYPHLGQA